MNVVAVKKEEGIFKRGHVGHPRPVHPIPPHERRSMFYVEFEERDRELFNVVFGDEDTALAAMSIVHNAPPEMQVVVFQLLKMIEEVV